MLAKACLFPPSWEPKFWHHNYDHPISQCVYKKNSLRSSVSAQLRNNHIHDGWVWLPKPRTCPSPEYGTWMATMILIDRATEKISLWHGTKVETYWIEFCRNIIESFWRCVSVGHSMTSPSLIWCSCWSWFLVQYTFFLDPAYGDQLSHYVQWHQPWTQLDGAGRNI